MSYRVRRAYGSAKPRRAPGGLRLRAGRGPVGETWWGRRWTQTLESMGWSTRLERGRTYARQGSVSAIKVTKGLVRGTVRGALSRPYEVKARLAPLSPKDWGRVADAIARQALHAAQLLAGEMPGGIEKAFPADKPLFPRSRKDVDFSCSCPDPANPCKHIVAVYYLLAEEFDRDPFLLFLLRGITRARLLAEVRARRRPGSAAKARRTKAPAGTDLSARLEGFFALAKELPAGWGPTPARLAEAPAPGARLKELGVPPFWRGELDFEDTLWHYYDSARERAEKLLGLEGPP